jgi:hypothetical protein
MSEYEVTTMISLIVGLNVSSNTAQHCFDTDNSGDVNIVDVVNMLRYIHDWTL